MSCRTVASPYPRPEIPLCVPTCPTYTLLPLEIPPPYPSHELPQLPSVRGRTSCNDLFTVTTHLIPAAYPRSTPDVPLPDPPAWTRNKTQWKDAVLAKVDEVISTKQKQLGGKLGNVPSRKPLWVCINRYRRASTRAADNNLGVTLFFAHATGYTKEIWEPVINHLFASGSHTSQYNVEEIWSWEAISHGDSAIVNAQRLSGVYDWKDNARDILHFLLHYLPPSSSDTSLPVHLARLPEGIAERRKQYGLESRSLVCIGHSNGGNSLIHAGIAQPSLFSSIVLIDPTVLPPPGDGLHMYPGSYNIIVDVMQRRERWRSSKEARSSFASAEFFQRWDPDVFDAFINSVLCDDGKNGVKLKMRPIHEAIALADAQSQYEAWMLLPRLSASIRLFWIMPGLPLPDMVIPPEKNFEVRQNMVWRRPENASNVRIQGTSHLIVHEAPKAVAQHLSAYLTRTYGMKTKGRL